MKQCAFISCDKLDGFVFDDELAIPHFEKDGWTVSTQSWSTPCDWSQFDAAIVRTTWDYTQNLDLFLEKMAEVDQATRLINPLPILQWNARKTYMKDLLKWGLPCIPTLFEAPRHWAELFEKWQTQKIMVKPQVGASAEGTQVVLPNSPPPKLGSMPMIQPFLQSVIDEGEFSFHFFNGEYSHCVLKIPKPNDYRVQEEHGGNILAINPDKADLKSAQNVQKTLQSHLPPYLYSRIDMVRNPQGQLQIMEVELIEPALYLRTNEASSSCFYKAFVEFIKN